MTTLVEILNAEGNRPNVVNDTIALIESEVERKSGASGFAIRKAFALISNIDNGNLLRRAVDNLLNRFVVALEPYYQSYELSDNKQGVSFSKFLVSQDTAVAEALLQVTDDVRGKINNRIVGKAYDRLRPSAAGHVLEAIPAIGALMQKYAYDQQAA